MFSNPFNSKFVSDVTKFLKEHRNDVDIDPCLNERAKEAVESLESEVILEDRRRVIALLFNEAVSSCGCKGSTKEANAFAKAVEIHSEARKIVVPAKPTKEPSHKASELATPKEVAKKVKRPFGEESEVEEAKKDLPPAFLKNIQKKKDAAKKKGDEKKGDEKKEEVEEESWEGGNRRTFDRFHEGFAQPTNAELNASVKWLESILKDSEKLKASGMSREDAQENLAAAKDMLSFGKAHGSKVKK